MDTTLVLSVSRAKCTEKKSPLAGVAARNVVGELYPTIGLQTPGESIETNFGQSSFVYAIDEELLVSALYEASIAHCYISTGGAHASSTQYRSTSFASMQSRLVQ